MLWRGDRYQNHGQVNHMSEFLDRDKALSFPFANGQYDHKHANEHYIFGCEAYKEWLEQLPTDIVHCKDCIHRGNEEECPMCFVEWVEYEDDGYIEHDDIFHDNTTDDGFCHKGMMRLKREYEK